MAARTMCVSETITPDVVGEFATVLIAVFFGTILLRDCVQLGGDRTGLESPVITWSNLNRFVQFFSPPCKQN